MLPSPAIAPIFNSIDATLPGDTLGELEVVDAAAENAESAALDRCQPFGLKQPVVGRGGCPLAVSGRLVLCKRRLDLHGRDVQVVSE